MNGLQVYLRLNNIRTSTYLILLAAFLLCINFFMIFLVHRTVGYLKGDAQTINHAGIIRGSIQRVSKLELSGQSEKCELLIQETDHLFRAFLSDEMRPLLRKKHEEFISVYLRELEERWQHLKKLLKDYRLNPSDPLRMQIVRESEICWEIADAAVLKAQIATEDKVGGIKLFYLLLTVYALNTLLVIWIVYAYVRKKLEYQASHDSLTGLLNRHSYEIYMEKELERSKRYGRNLSLILFDADHFKKINDTYGHKTGDMVLIRLGQTVTKSLRKSDMVFRVGGEEFAVICPETESGKAVILAEKLREKVEKYFSETGLPVSISLGIAESSPAVTQSDIYRHADEALYKAKIKGRNRVEIYGNPMI